MKNKRGQFYLIAAVMLIVVIIGLVSIVNYTSSKDDSKVNLYGDKLKIESEKVLDYDLNNGANEIENFTRSYSNYMGSNVNAYFIVGINSSLRAYTYIAGVKLDLTNNLEVSDGKIYFTAEDTEYIFDLNKGQNFYFILYQETDSGNYVYVNNY